MNASCVVLIFFDLSVEGSCFLLAFGDFCENAIEIVGDLVDSE